MKRAKTKPQEERLLVGDTGALIDHHFSRKRYAKETLQAIFEYGFGELGVEEMFLETNKETEPFRQFMSGLGLRDTQKEERNDVLRFGREGGEGGAEGEGEMAFVGWVAARCQVVGFKYRTKRKV